MRWKLADWLYRCVQRLRLYLGCRLYGISYVARRITFLPDFLIAPTLRRYGAHIAEGVNFQGSLAIDNPDASVPTEAGLANLSISENCFVGKSVFFDLPECIELGRDVVLGAGVHIYTHQDVGNRMMSRWYPRKQAPVRLGDGTYVGANAIILCGVELGRCCVVGAGSVVTQSFPEFSVVAGIPARKLKSLDPAS